MPDRSPWPRRLLMPLVILAVATVLFWRSAGVESKQHLAVRGLVTEVCVHVVEGRDPTPRLAGTNELIRETLVQRLKEVLDPNARLTIEIVEGDTPEAGSATGTATHIALVKQDGTQVIGLRVAHGDKPGDVAIIGFF